MIYAKLGSVNVPATGTIQRTNKDIIPAGRGRKHIYELFLNKCRQLTVDENGYTLLL
jgi:hypothetical protein